MPTIERESRAPMTLEEATDAYLSGTLDEDEFERIEAEYAPNYVEGARALSMSRSSWDEEKHQGRLGFLLRLLFGK